MGALRGIANQRTEVMRPTRLDGPTEGRALESSLGLAELRAFRLRIDAPLSPSELTDPSRALDLYFGRTLGPDALRVPPLENASGPEVRASIRRVLDVDVSQASGSTASHERELRMHRALEAIDRSMRDIIDRTQKPI